MDHFRNRNVTHKVSLLQARFVRYFDNFAYFILMKWLVRLFPSTMFCHEKEKSSEENGTRKFDIFRKMHFYS